MELEELKVFLRDLSINMDKSNFEQFKKKASMLLGFDVNMPAEQLATTLNNMRIYENALEALDGDVDQLVAIVKRMMTETEIFLMFAKQFYIQHKDSFNWLNTISKNWISNPNNVHPEYYTVDVIDYMMNQPDSSVFNNDSAFIDILDCDNDDVISATIDHPNFTKIIDPSALVFLLVDADYHSILTEKRFNKVFDIFVRIKDESFWDVMHIPKIIESPHLKPIHLKQFDLEVHELIVGYVKQFDKKIHNDLKVFLFDSTGDEYLLPEEAKEVFLF